MRSQALVPALLCFAAAANSISAQSGQIVAQLDESFVKDVLALDPVGATAQGYHQHNGLVLDEQLDDFSKAGVARALAVYKGYLSRVTEASNAHLDAEDRADLEVIRLQCEAQLLEWQDVQGFRHNPTEYVELLGNAVYEPLILTYAPERQRLGQITARLEKIPAFVQTAISNLVSAPGIWIDVAREENAGTITLIDVDIRKKVAAEDRPRYDKAAAAAIKALRQFDQFLKNDLGKHPFDWRLGPRFYPEKFKLTLATGDTPQRVLRDAEAKLESIRQDMRQQAAALYPKYFPGKPVPGDLNTLVSQVLNRVAQTHATPQTYFADAKGDLTAATQFVKHKRLLALPNADNLQVIPTPAFMRGIYGVGGFAAAPVLEPQLGAYYWITPMTPDMTPARVESKLREYNRWGLMILTIHEAMPGHYVQFEYSAQVQPKWRGVLRAICGNVPYVEGWAVYATQLLIEEGFVASPEMKLTFGKQMLRVVSNTILDIRLQSMNMTDQQALDLMIQQTFQEQEEAEKKLQRAKLSSCQLPTYFVGWRGWDQIRRRYQAQRGQSFRLSEFHERALREGAISLPALQSVLLAR